MCSRFDLNDDIRAFQVRLALDMEKIIRHVPDPYGRATGEIAEPGHYAPHDAPDDFSRHENTKANGQQGDFSPSGDARDNAKSNDSNAGSGETGDNGDDGNDGGDDGGNAENDPTFYGLSGIRRPTDPVAVIVPAWSLGTRRWGLPRPVQAQNMAGSGNNAPLINARSETLDQKPTFRPLLQRRCLVPATGWYEWRKEGRNRHKNHITLPDHQPFLFAGLENGTDVVIITCAPAGSIAHIHDRMPAIIGPNHLHHWLDAKRPFAAVRHMLGPVPDGILHWEEQEPENAQSNSRRAEDTSQMDLF
ncbi:SOS response-associated peptidase [Thalassospira marina]|nr:SOS response-associated peptidase [Thalassospira marina]